jgi:Mg-chelatase subunit ChlD
MGEARDGLESSVDRLEARGDTALLDAVSLAYDRLQALGDQERINAIVAITDGRENHSEITLARLARQIRDGNQAGVPVVVFCIAYGDDADMNTLQSIAEASGGQARRGDPETIRQLYKILSTYF